MTEEQTKPVKTLEQIDKEYSDHAANLGHKTFQGELLSRQCQFHKAEMAKLNHEADQLRVAAAKQLEHATLTEGGAA